MQKRIKNLCLLIRSGIRAVAMVFMISTVVVSQTGGACSGADGLLSSTLLAADRARNRSLRFEQTDMLKMNLTSRKSSYRIDEMVAIDIGLLNRSIEGLYAYALTKPVLDVRVRDESDGDLAVGRYEVNFLGYSTNMYTYIGPSQFSEGHINILIGCNEPDDYIKKKASIFNNSTQPADSQRALFSEDMFKSWGDFCLPIDKPGRYRISVKLIEGLHVNRLSGCKIHPKTLVSSIESSAFQIDIVR